jgi:RecA-family ATPase
MDTLDRARQYLAKLPPAVAGQNGHSQTFRVACVLVQGFALSTADARGLMQEYSSRCVPPWTEKEIEHKLKDAETTPEPKGRGYLLKGLKHIYRDPQDTPSKPAAPTPTPTASRSPEPKQKPKRYHSSATAANPIPDPLPNGAAQLLSSAFEENEGVRISIGRNDEKDGREVPKDSGVCLSREEWILKLQKNDGNPNKILSSSQKNGIFISINPMKLGGSRDSDVTAYRHVLLEFDHISKQEQWNLIVQSKIPATAVIYSGGKSLHAWVRVDAQNRAEYDERVKILYKHFEDYKPDTQNKNPSRFSRLPNCVRAKARQELLALKIGAESFSSWQIEQEADALGEEVQVKDLLGFVSASDPNNVLGQRWLCKGGSCLIVAQSGIGKSSLEMQLAVLWGLGRPAFGVVPIRPLKSLIVQAENDMGDMAEMFQGVWLGANMPADAETTRQIQDHLVIRNITTQTGMIFCESLRRLIDLHKPDLVWIDPLLAYLGDDVSKQSVCSQFLRNGLNPISKSTGVIWMIVHHTGKPQKDAKAKSHFTSTDLSYEGLGSAELTGWARAVVILNKTDERLYKLILGKRGKRAGARDLLNNPTTEVWLTYADQGICWKQIAAPSEEEQEVIKGKRGQKATGKPFDFDGFFASVHGEHFSAGKLAERASKFSGLAESTIYRKIIGELKSRMIFDPTLKTYSVETSTEPF